LTPDITRPRQHKLYILLAFALFAGSLGPVTIRYAFQYHIPPDVITALRMSFASLVFAPIAWSRYGHELRTINRQNLIFAGAAGTMFGLNVVMMIISLEHISVMINQVLIGTSPIWVAMFEVAFLKVRLSRTVWLGIIVAFSGGILIAVSTSGTPAIIQGGNATLGVGLATLSSIFSSVYLIIGRKARSHVSFIPYMWLVYTAGAIVTLVIVAINQTPIIGYAPQAYFWVLMLALVAQLMAHGSFNYLLGYMQATTISVSSQSVPILSTVWALLIFTEIPTVLQVIGGIIIIVGVTIVISRQSIRKKKA
jgi:drug/metabolite transporter (DMT)-like permease